jgi:hypothetical protein
MKKTIFIVLTASVCFGSCCIATAQAPVAQSDEITDGDTEEIIQADSSSTGSFAVVTVDPSASSDVALQFPVSLYNRHAWRVELCDAALWVSRLSTH